MLWYVVGFSAAGAIVGLISARFAFRLGGCKNLTVTVLFIVVMAFLGLGASTATHWFSPTSSLYVDDGVNPVRQVSTSAPDFAETEPVCTATIAETVFNVCMLNTANKKFTSRNYSLQNFLLFGLQINMLVIMLEMIAEKRRTVTAANGPESWAMQSGKVFINFTLYLFVPLNLFFAYFIPYVDPEHKVTGVYAFFINAIGVLKDYLQFMDSELKDSVTITDYRAVLVSNTMRFK